MKRLLFVLSLFVFVQTQVYSQSATNTLSGTVLDYTTKEQIGYASIRILNSKDSTFVSGGSTSENGRFNIPLASGKYIVRVSYLGFQDYHRNVNLSKNTNLGNIFMNEDAVALSEAVVEAKAIEIMVKGDTIEYNADSYKVQESAVVEDLLKKMPGVEIDADGKITVNGNEVKKILLDGKEFFSDDPKIASKNLPAKMVDKLQVLDRKSDMALMTGFDDGNEETVINLTVKAGMKEGVFGNAVAGYGNKDRYESNGMVNYMRNNTQVSALGGINNTNNAGASDLSSAMFGNDSGSGRPRGLRFGSNNGITKSITGGVNFATEHSDKLKWGGDIRYGNNNNEVTSHSNRIYTSEGNPGTQITDAWGNNKGQSLAANFKFEWTPDSLTKIIFSPQVEYNTNNKLQESSSLAEFGLRPEGNNESSSRYLSDGEGYKLNGKLDMSRQFKKANSKMNRVFSVGVSGGYNKNESDGFDFNATEYINDPTKNITDDINFFQNNKTDNWKVFLSYVEPIKQGDSYQNFLELSYNISNRNSNNDKKSYYNIGTELDPDYSEVDEKYTGYVDNEFLNQNVSLKFREQRMRKNGHSYNYVLGLGLESSSLKTSSVTPIEEDKLPRKTFYNFAPSAQFNYMWDKRHNLRIDYKGTTTAPSATQLMKGFAESGINHTFGNPDLRPSFENRVNLRYRKFNAEQASFMGASASFTHTSNAIASTSTLNEQMGRDITYVNVSGNMGGNARLMFNRPLRNRNWSINSMSFVSYDIKNTIIDQLKNKAKTLSLQENAGIQFKSTIIDFALRGNIRYSKMNNSINKTNNRNSADYGGTYDFTFYVPNPLKGVTFFEHILSDLTIDSDINYSTNSGYGEGFEKQEWLWNASISKLLFKNKAGTIRFKMYDILKERSNISRTYDAAYVEDVISNSISNYFMVHFVYRFQIFKGGVKMGDMNGGSRRGMGGGRPAH